MGHAASASCAAAGNDMKQIIKAANAMGYFISGHIFHYFLFHSSTTAVRISISSVTSAFVCDVAFTITEYGPISSPSVTFNVTFPLHPASRVMTDRFSTAILALSILVVVRLYVSSSLAMFSIMIRYVALHPRTVIWLVVSVLKILSDPAMIAGIVITHDVAMHIRAMKLFVALFNFTALLVYLTATVHFIRTWIRIVSDIVP